MSDRAYDLMRQAERLSHGVEQVAILEEAVREADSAGDIHAGYWIRMELVDAATHSGFQEKALVAFSWCLARFDDEPEEFDEHDLLWKYKWILDHLPAFPQVSREQIAGMQDDMERRYEERSYSLRPVHYMRLSNAMRMGKFDEAMAHREKFKEARRDWMADCAACERDKEVELMARRKQDSKSLTLAKPILAGKLSCLEVPELTYGMLMRPLLRRGELQTAEEFHEKSYRRITRNRDYLGCAAEHLLYLVRAERFQKAVPVMQRHLRWSVDTANLDAKFCFFASVMTLNEALSRRKSKTRKLKLPKQLSCYREDGTYVPAELAIWFQNEAEKLAAQFNERNGNDYYTRQVEETRELAVASG